MANVGTLAYLASVELIYGPVSIDQVGYSGGCCIRRQVIYPIKVCKGVP